MMLQRIAERLGALSMSPKQLVTLGLVLFALGLGQIAGSVALAVSIAEQRAEAGEGGAETASVCRDRLRSLGLKAEIDSATDTIQASRAGLGDAAVRLGEASVATMLCPGWEMVRFCMGEGCEDSDGFSMELKFAG